MRVLLYIHSRITRTLCLILFVFLTPILQASENSEYESNMIIKPIELESDERCDMICDYKGEIYLLQSNNNKVQKIGPNPHILAEIGGFGFGVGQFNNPTSIYTNDGGLNIYVLDSENRRIARLNSDLKWLDQITLESAYDNQAVGDLTGLALNSLGEFYVSDPRNFRILKLDAEGKLSGILSGRSKLIIPGDLLCDKRDYVYACNQTDSSIVCFDDLGNLSGRTKNELFKIPQRIAVHEERLLILDGSPNSIYLCSFDGRQLDQLVQGRDQRTDYAAIASDRENIIIYEALIDYLRIFNKREK